MIVHEEISLKEFPFWGLAETTIQYLTDKDFEMLESELEYDTRSNIGINKTDLNDLFAYDEDYIANILGYDDFEQLVEDRS